MGGQCAVSCARQAGSRGRAPGETPPGGKILHETRAAPLSRRIRHSRTVAIRGAKNRSIRFGRSDLCARSYPIPSNQKVPDMRKNLTLSLPPAALASLPTLSRSWHSEHQQLRMTPESTRGNRGGITGPLPMPIRWTDTHGSLPSGPSIGCPAAGASSGAAYPEESDAPPRPSSS